MNLSTLTFSTLVRVANDLLSRNSTSDEELRDLTQELLVRASRYWAHSSLLITRLDELLDRIDRTFQGESSNDRLLQILDEHRRDGDQWMECSFSGALRRRLRAHCNEEPRNA